MKYISYSKIQFYMSVMLNSYSKHFIQLVEHQKSGGTWIARILSDYFDIPFYDEAGHWMNRMGVVRLHSKYQYSLRPSNQIYILRDGRDVLTSYYFHLFYRKKIPQIRFFGNIEDIKSNMPIYLDKYFNNKLGNNIIWNSHVNYWLNKIHYIVRYEEMANNSFKTMSNIINLFIEDIDNEKLIKSIEKYDFKKVSGRERGQEDQKSFFRKGISGDWKNYFNKKAAEIFHFYAGDTLIALGYEKDDSWIDKCEQ